METLDLKNVKIKTLDNKRILGFKDYQFIKCKFKKESYGFYRKGNSEWRPFIGLILDNVMSFKLGILIHKIVDMKDNQITKEISFILGGGKWLEKERVLYF